MIFASKHRVDSQTFTQPAMDESGHLPFKIVDIQDIKKQLLAVERVEREEERKGKKKEQLPRVCSVSEFIHNDAILLHVLNFCVPFAGCCDLTWHLLS